MTGFTTNTSANNYTTFNVGRESFVRHVSVEREGSGDSEEGVRADYRIVYTHETTVGDVGECQTMEFY